MPHAEAYNEALESANEVEHLRKRFLELTEQNIGLEQRVEELMAAVEHVNNAGMLKARALEARVAELEMVREAAKKVARWVGAQGYHLLPQSQIDGFLELCESLAALEPPQEVQVQDVQSLQS